MLPTVLATTPRVGHLFGKGVHRGKVYVGKTKDPVTGKEVYQTVTQKEWETHPKNPAAQKATKAAKKQANTNETRLVNADKELRAQGKKPTVSDSVKAAEQKVAKQKAGVTTQNQAKPQPLKGETPGNSRTNADPRHLQPNSIRQDRPLTQQGAAALRRQTQGANLKGTTPQPRPLNRSVPVKASKKAASGKGVVKAPQPSGLHSQILRTIDGEKPNSLQAALSNSDKVVAEKLAARKAELLAKLGKLGKGAGAALTVAAIVSELKEIADRSNSFSWNRAKPAANPKNGDTTIKEGHKFVFKDGKWLKAAATTPKPAAKPTVADYQDAQGNTYDGNSGRLKASAQTRPAASADAQPVLRSPAASAPISAPPQRVRPTVGAPTVTGTSPAAALPGREWKDFNPGRGTSATNNPLIQTDPWLLGKIKEREGKAAAPAAAKPVAAQPLKNETSLLEQLRKKKQLRGAGYDLYSTIG